MYILFAPLCFHSNAGRHGHVTLTSRQIKNQTTQSNWTPEKVCIWCLAPVLNLPTTVYWLWVCFKCNYTFCAYIFWQLRHAAMSMQNELTISIQQGTRGHILWCTGKIYIPEARWCSWCRFVLWPMPARCLHTLSSLLFRKWIIVLWRSEIYFSWNKGYI